MGLPSEISLVSTLMATDETMTSKFDSILFTKLFKIYKVFRKKERKRITLNSSDF